MAYLLGIDTGGTYTDAVILDDESDVIVAKAKSLTTRPDLAQGIGTAIDAVLAQGDVGGENIAMVSLSTTLATNALVEGQGGRVGLVFIGFDEAELARSDLADALGDGPVLILKGGHTHAGNECVPLDKDAISHGLETFSDVTAVAIASKFATRNPDHELRVRTIVRDMLAVPVTCSHELSKSLGGPKRALTAVLNARLVGLIDRLIVATERHLNDCAITARLMVVRGDGALISADQARIRPIETILSGPAASIAGAQWLTGVQDAVVSDIGGTTTDVCLLRDGVPKIDLQGAKVGRYRTMVEAVAMRTFGLGGDSEVRVNDGLVGGVALGPRRVMPVSLLAQEHPEVVHKALDQGLSFETASETATRFAIAQWDLMPSDLDARETLVAQRLEAGPLPWAKAITSRVEVPALERLVQRGLVLVADVTPSDASLVLGILSSWDKFAAEKALSLMAKRRVGSGSRLSVGPRELAQTIIDQLTDQSRLAVLETALADEGWDNPSELAVHPLLAAGLADHSNVIRVSAGLAVPVIGLGASAQSYYGAVGEQLGCATILPNHGGVANAIGAVVGQVVINAQGTVSSTGEGAFVVHLPNGPETFINKNEALDALRRVLTAEAEKGARDAGVDDLRISESLDLQEAEIEARPIFIEARLRVTARGRPRIAG